MIDLASDWIFLILIIALVITIGVFVIIHDGQIYKHCEPSGGELKGSSFLTNECYKEIDGVLVRVIPKKIDGKWRLVKDR